MAKGWKLSMIKLTPEQIKTRFDDLYETHINNMGLSIVAKMALSTIMPDIQAVLADESKQTELLNLMEALAACIGRKAFFVWEDEIEYIQNIKAISQE